MIIGLRDRFARLDDLLRRTSGTFCRPDDGPELRLRKAVLVLSSLLFTLAGVVWGALYLLLGETSAGLIPISYAVISLISLAYFVATKDFRTYRISQLVLILLLPALLMAALGGYRAGSAAVLWAAVAPLGALLFASPARGQRWLLAYLLILIVLGALESQLGSGNNLSATVVTALFVLNLGAVTVVFYVMLNHFVSERDRIHRLLEREQEKSERLLLNVLPKEIAPLLKESETVAQRFESTSILFADLVGFTTLSAELPAEEVVELLNSIVSHFDALAERIGVEKIRTIGDSYMAAAGVPVARPDHAQALARMALAMRSYLRTRNQQADRALQVRMGMATGSVIGAVIGTSKFHYDVWGQPVNLASRLESSGVEGRIQIDAETQRRLAGDFECSYRGKIELKGMGTVQSWFLEGSASERGG